MNSQPASARNPAACLRLLLLSPVLFSSLQACISGPSITHRVPVPDEAHVRVERPVGVEQIPMKVGVYFPADFTDYKYQEYTIGRSKIEIPVGAISQAHFNKVLSAMFADTMIVQHRPPFSDTYSQSNLSALVEVQLEDFQWTSQTFGPSTASVTYRFTIYSPSGNTVSSWTESGANTAEMGFTEDPDMFIGKRVTEAVNVASGRFMDNIQDRPEMQRWLAVINEKKKIASTSEPLKGDGDARSSTKRELKGVKIEATLYSQHGLDRRPYHSTGVRSQILAAEVKITNDGPDTILVRSSDITLSPRKNERLYPASPTKVARRIHQAPSSEASDVIGGFNPLFGVAVAAAEGSDKNRDIDNIEDYVRSNQLADTALGPNESVAGFVYFEALGIDGKFDEADLRVRLGETTSIDNFVATLRVGRGTEVATEIALASAKTTSIAKVAAPPEKKVSPTADPTKPVRMISARELLDLLSNATSSGTSESGTEFANYNRRDGRMVARTAKGHVDEGIWEIVGDAQYCRQWNKWRSAAYDCYYVYRLPDGRYRFKGLDKPYDSIVSIVPGDPRQLQRRLSAAEGKPLELKATAAPQ